MLVIVKHANEMLLREVCSFCSFCSSSGSYLKLREVTISRKWSHDEGSSASVFGGGAWLQHVFHSYFIVFIFKQCTIRYSV